jgi:hypothetical protein
MRVQLRLAPPPVVIGRPIPRQRLNDGELHALLWLGFLLRPPRCVDTPAQFGKFSFRNIHMKRTNCGLITACLLCNFSHRPFSVVVNGLLHFFLRINNDDWMQKTMLCGDVLISRRKKSPPRFRKAFGRALTLFLWLMDETPDENSW